MAQSVGIFRHRSRRPFDRSVRQKFTVPTLFVAPTLPSPGWLEEFTHRRAYSFIKRKRIPPDVRWQIARPRSFTREHFPEAPGYLEAIKQQRNQLGWKFPVADVRWQLRRNAKRWVVPTVVPPVSAQEPGFIAAIREQRKQLGWKFPTPDVRWQLKRHARRWIVPTREHFPPAPGWKEIIYKRNQELRHLVFRVQPDVRWQITRPRVYGIVPAPPTQEVPGFLAEIYRRRSTLRALVAREPADVRWQLRRKFIVPGLFVPGIGADIGWLVSYLIKVKHGTNLRR